MNKSPRVLCIEDTLIDFELIIRELGKSNLAFSFHRIQSEEEMRLALETSRWDIILSDFNLPGFGAIRALEIMREMGFEIPFVIVSGAVGEEAAIACIKSGASDFVFKNKLFRLETVVQRELRESEDRNMKMKIQNELNQKRSEIAFLGDVSKALGASLDSDKTLNSACRMAVLKISDVSIVDMLQENNKIKRVSVAHRDPEKNTIAQNLLKYSPDVNRYVEIESAVLTGDTGLVEITQEFLRQRSQSLDHRETINALDVRTMLIVPMKARGKILGTWSFLFSNEIKDIPLDTVELAKEFVSRSAVAIDNADLYMKSQLALKSRDDFLSIASHELNTPLTSIKLQIDAAERNVSKPGSEFSIERVRKALGVANKQVDRLTALIDDLLNVASIQAGRVRYQYEEMNLAELVDEVVDKFSMQLRAADCHIEQYIPVQLNGMWDRSRVEQVFVNLISNAIKYAPGSKIIIKARSNHAGVEISFQDFGTGIPKEKHNQIFSRYERASAAQYIPGLGLGLFIVKQIIVNHKGTINFDSEVDRGTTFHIQLPFDSRS